MRGPVRVQSVADLGGRAEARMGSNAAWLTRVVTVSHDGWRRRTSLRCRSRGYCRSESIQSRPKPRDQHDLGVWTVRTGWVVSNRACSWPGRVPFSGIRDGLAPTARLATMTFSSYLSTGTSTSTRLKVVLIWLGTPTNWGFNPNSGSGRRWGDGGNGGSRGRGAQEAKNDHAAEQERRGADGEGEPVAIRDGLGGQGAGGEFGGGVA
jgi:hypothetical protein